MLIDPVPLLSQSFLTLLVSMMTMKWTGLFYTIFIFYQELDLYYGNKPLYLRHIIFILPWQQKSEINLVKK